MRELPGININNIIPVIKSQTLDVFESRDHSIYLISGVVCDNEDFLTHSVVTLNESNFNQLVTVDCAASHSFSV